MPSVVFAPQEGTTAESQCLSLLILPFFFLFSSAFIFFASSLSFLYSSFFSESGLGTLLMELSRAAHSSGRRRAMRGFQKVCLHNIVRTRPVSRSHWSSVKHKSRVLTFSLPSPPPAVLEIMKRTVLCMCVYEASCPERNKNNTAAQVRSLYPLFVLR